MLHPSLLCEIPHNQVQIQLSYTVAARSIPTAFVVAQKEQVQQLYSLTLMEFCSKLVIASVFIFKLCSCGFLRYPNLLIALSLASFFVSLEPMKLTTYTNWLGKLLTRADPPVQSSTLIIYVDPKDS